MFVSCQQQENRKYTIAVSAGAWDIQLMPPGAYDVRYVASRYSIGVALDPQMGIHAIGTDRRQGFRTQVGAVGCIPSGCDVYSASDHGGEYLRLLARQDSGAEREPKPAGSADLLALACDLRRALLVGADPLSCESIAQVIVERLSSGCDQDLEKPRGWITSRRLQRVEDLIEAGLESGILVSELAGGLGLSTPFFSRAVREETGRSPQEHILRRRVQRACNLLRTGQNSLACIAAECGFASHAHMSNLFRTRLGISPSELRAGTGD